MLWHDPLWCALAALVALSLDACWGDPQALYRRLPHPVVLMGRGLEAARSRLRFKNPMVRRWAGAATLVALLSVVGLIATGLHLGCAHLPYGWLPEGLLASSLLAARGLHDGVRAIQTARNRTDTEHALAQLVTRDVQQLDAPAIARATIESLAENFSDALIAPLLWYLAFGLPGLAVYKAINTADSMIGYKTPRLRDFGMPAARLDDIANWLPARLSVLPIATAALFLPNAHARQALRQPWRWARQHSSPNAGWPEAAFAGALNLALGGPRVYPHEGVRSQWIGDGNPNPDQADIARALTLFQGAWCAAGVAVVVMVLAMVLAMAL